MDEYISRQAAIEALHMHLMYRMGTDSNKKRLDDWINSLPSAQPEPRWIPCSERLPEESGQYLITVKYEHVDGYEDIYDEHGDWDGEEWDMFCFGHCGKVESIIAWMPLPEPYREDIE